MPPGNLIHLDRASPQPLYLQIVYQIKAQISDGRLPVSSRLPTVRQLARDLGVTRLTVQNGYDVLQADSWIECTVGRGTFVSPSVRPSNLIAAVERQPTPDVALDNIARVSQIVGLRSLAYAEADPELFPAREFWDGLTHLRSDAASLLQHGLSQGDPVLRIELAALLREQSVEVVPNDILITSGALQGLSLITEVLAGPGDYVAIEDPTYHGLLNILKMRGIHPICIPTDEEGPRLDALERIIVEYHPRFFYTIPSFHNPTGQCISDGRRRDLLAVAQCYHLTLVEDDCYSRLSYDSPPPTPMKAQDTTANVIYLSGLSKIMMSGLRVGYVVAPAPIHQQLLSLHRATILCTPPLIQRAVAEFLRHGRLKPHLRRVLPIYRQRRDTLLSTLELSMPDWVRWTLPAGGFSCWLSFPRDRIGGDLHRLALERGVAFTPGEIFLTEDSGNEHLRLCFGNQPKEVIGDCILQLGRLLRTMTRPDLRWSFKTH